MKTKMKTKMNFYICVFNGRQSKAQTRRCRKSLNFSVQIHVVLRYVMLRYVTLRYVTLCYDMSRYVRTYLCTPAHLILAYLKPFEFSQKPRSDEAKSFQKPKVFASVSWSQFSYNRFAETVTSGRNLGFIGLHRAP